ncbi:MAG TPA: extracellular solute-binding protein [Hyphomicrobiaceae bacterium]|nr:extracellular solute-binding protein [Hyphomicrobiaceae bacterium]
MDVTRRSVMKTGAAAAAALSMPYYARAQGRGWDKLKGQTIVVNWPAHPHYAVAKKLLPEFTAATGIKVELDEMPYLRLKDAQVLQMGKPKGDYDVCVYVIMWKTEYVHRKFLTELEPMFQNAELAMPDYDRGDIIKGYYEGLGLVGGPRGYLPGPGAKLYGIPYGAECSVLAYRKDIFAKHNLTVPKTYDDLLAACRAVKQKEAGMGGLTSRAQAGHQVTAGWLLHLTPYDGLVIDDKYLPRVADEPSLKATAVFKEIIDTGPAGGASFDFGQMMNAFLQGQSAMYLDTISVFGPARDPARSKIADTVGYAVHPKAAKYSGELGGFGMAIPNNSERKEAAFAFIQWMTAKAQDVKASAMGGQPMRLSTLDHPDVQKVYPVDVYRECLKIANPDWRPIINEWTEISEKVLGVHLSEIITGKAEIKPSMTEAAAKIKAICERAGYYKT